MYLAENKRNGKRHYIIRESYKEGEKKLFRDLYQLGENPNDHIVYPGGSSFHFKDGLIQSLIRQGVNRPESELEKIFFPFLPPNIQRIINQMTHLGRKRKPQLTKEAMARAQAGIHLFDRRRLFLLRFGRMDSPAVIMRPHKFLNVLVDMCRDEKENHFRALETSLRIRERKQYVYQTMDLGRFFPGDFARLFPLGLSQGKLDEIFLQELCRINVDADFMEVPGSPDQLSEYLTRYLFFWFDHEFGEKPTFNGVFEEFIRSRSGYRPPPPPKPAVPQEKALKIFNYTKEEWRLASRKEILGKYRKLALKCHPDQGGCSEDFIELNQAFECLVQGK